MSLLERPILELLRVPQEPDPPAGDPESLRVFRAAKSYLTYRRLRWAFQQASAVAGVLIFLSFSTRWGFERFLSGTPSFVPPLVQLVETFAIAGLILQIPFTFALTHLDYHYRWYMTTDRSLRIREGVTTIREQTMTFSNIQNVSIRQGPLQRLFGIFDVEVRSAGGGGSEKPEDQIGAGEDLHLGYFRGVSNAAEIRDLILASMRRAKGSGLGDPEEARLDTRDHETVAAARLLLEEARALRRAVA